MSFTVDRYRHLAEDVDDAVVDRLDALLAATQAPPRAPVVGLPRSS
jgi:hypothetical protein